MILQMEILKRKTKNSHKLKSIRLKDCHIVILWGFCVSSLSCSCSLTKANLLKLLKVKTVCLSDSCPLMTYSLCACFIGWNSVDADINNLVTTIEKGFKIFWALKMESKGRRWRDCEGYDTKASASKRVQSARRSPVTNTWECKQGVQVRKLS